MTRLETDAELRRRIVAIHGWSTSPSVLEAEGEDLDDCAERVGLTRRVVRDETARPLAVRR